MPTALEVERFDVPVSAEPVVWTGIGRKRISSRDLGFIAFEMESYGNGEAFGARSSRRLQHYHRGAEPSRGNGFDPRVAASRYASKPSERTSRPISRITMTSYGQNEGAGHAGAAPGPIPDSSQCRSDLVFERTCWLFCWIRAACAIAGSSGPKRARMRAVFTIVLHAAPWVRSTL